MAKKPIDKAYLKTQIDNYKTNVLDVEFVDKNTALGYIRNLANRVATLEGSGGSSSSGSTSSGGTSTATVPTKTSDLTNDSNFVSDSSYVHTDNNYTTTEKNKLAGIASGAEVNTISQIKVNGSVVTPSSKVVSLTIPTSLSGLGVSVDGTTIKLENGVLKAVGGTSSGGSSSGGGTTDGVETSQINIATLLAIDFTTEYTSPVVNEAVIDANYTIATGDLDFSSYE